MEKDLMSYIKNMEERNKKLLEFSKKNIDELQKEEIQNKSDIKVFNIIGTFGDDNGYNVVYFKTKKVGLYNDEPTLVDIHYIHLYKEYELKLSIFYDGNGSILSSLGYPHYELYDTKNTFRFNGDKNGELDLINKAVLLM